MSWSNWFSVGGGESMNEKTTETSDGGTKHESLRTIDGDKENHQHTWVTTDKDGNVTGGGATPNSDHKK